MIEEPSQAGAERPAVPPPSSGIPARQVFAIALIILAIYAVSGTVTFFVGTPSDKAAFAQSTINLALLAAGFYLGSSASSRAKDRQS